MVVIEPSDCVVNALWEAAKSGDFTVKDLLDKCPDMSPMTIYHRVERWRQIGIIKMVKKRENNKSHDLYKLDIDKFQKSFGKVIKS